MQIKRIAAALVINRQNAAAIAQSTIGISSSHCTTRAQLRIGSYDKQQVRKLPVSGAQADVVQVGLVAHVGRSVRVRDVAAPDENTYHWCKSKAKLVEIIQFIHSLIPHEE